MQKQTSVYIPKPCHEDWNKMTPTRQGKFCASCGKQVIDFSLMSDNQIINVLSNQTGKLCGRFDAEQLQRPLIETKIKKKKSWWMALTANPIQLCSSIAAGIYYVRLIDEQKKKSYMEKLIIQ